MNQDSKVIAWLKSLSKREFREFSLYVKSPFHCQHAGTVQLFEALAPHYPHFSDDPLHLFRKAFPSQDIDQPSFNVLKTYLIRLLRSFLVDMAWKKQQAMRSLLEAELLMERGLYTEAAKVARKLSAQLDTQPVLDTDRLYLDFRLLDLQVSLSLQAYERGLEIPLPQLFSTLDQFYLCHGLKYLTTATSFANLFGGKLPMDRWRRFKDIFQHSPASSHPLSEMYMYMVQLLVGESDASHLDALVKLLDEHRQQLSKIEALNLYGLLQNHLWRRYTQGATDVLPAIFSFYREMESLDLLFGHGEYSAHTFRNIVTAGIRLRELNWTREFIERNREKLKSDVGAAAMDYSLAYVDFSERAYGSALKRLQHLKFVDPFYRTGHQTLLLRIYYETEAWEPLYALAATFRRHANRVKSISKNRKAANLNFIGIVKALARIKERRRSRLQLEKVAERISSCTHLTDRTWLEEKLREEQSASFR